MLHVSRVFKEQFKKNEEQHLQNGTNNFSQKNIKPKKILFVSLEMTKNQIFERIVLATTHLTNKEIHNLSETDGPVKEKFINDIESISEEYDNILINDNDLTDFFQALARIQYLVQKDNIGLILIDYLQLLTINQKQKETNRQQEITQISKNIKLFAKKLNIPVILLSQLSRNVERRENKRPIMSDLRESGAIEQDADVILFLYRDSYYANTERNEAVEKQFIAQKAEDPEKGSDKVEVLISKNRNGEIGHCNLKFWGKYSYFWEERGN
ncbi:DnaB-like helicase C-terminal domain-containing protein [Mycoplasma sp. SG1]|uniref:DnaB-like helicase C-terminal domain-containing protein n=1 Tax=Mycoplasma sp. SG1 TaxID=2810348 RepID=UPI002AFE4A45|nr:DnaB-like helicase C-terminal domain-containing protein [Mycoplasma sp. SG1]URM52868.1 DnaB-like helicase C-terminal domain-containing protein [Mycoplasma sp. SG1]